MSGAARSQVTARAPRRAGAPDLTLAAPLRATASRTGARAYSCRPATPRRWLPPTYARLLAPQEGKRQRIATMALLIAPAAVLDGAALVTRKSQGFLADYRPRSRRVQDSAISWVTVPTATGRLRRCLSRRGRSECCTCPSSSRSRPFPSSTGSHRRCRGDPWGDSSYHGWRLTCPSRSSCSRHHLRTDSDRCWCCNTSDPRTCRRASRRHPGGRTWTSTYPVCLQRGCRPCRHHRRRR